MTHTVAIVPAWNRADTVGATVGALVELGDVGEVVVVDDGSKDRTSAAAEDAGARVVRLDRNLGKGGAVAAAIEACGAPSRYLLVDADLGESAGLAAMLLAPVITGDADMTVAVFPATGRSRGFGLVKRVAAAILHGVTGDEFVEPLSGQRAISGPLLRSLSLADRFGLELGLTLDVLAGGGHVAEVPIAFEHRPTSRDLAGVLHRARQGRDLLDAASRRLGWSRTLRLALPSLWRRRRR
ncbi:MAG: glycosyltransferase [Actinomycetota bacterium]|nr:glycosyltransferase [Actinomycetota bacterium]